MVLRWGTSCYSPNILGVETMSLQHHPYNVCPEHQTDATLSQANPISGTKYEVLATTKYVRIIAIAASVTWTLQPSPLQIWITVDGVSIGSIQMNNPVSTTKYYANIGAEDSEATLEIYASARAIYKAFILEGRSVKIEAETTGGTVQSLDVRVKYAKW